MLPTLGIVAALGAAALFRLGFAPREDRAAFLAYAWLLGAALAGAIELVTLLAGASVRALPWVLGAAGAAAACDVARSLARRWGADHGAPTSLPRRSTRASVVALVALGGVLVGVDSAVRASN